MFCEFLTGLPIVSAAAPIDCGSCPRQLFGLGAVNHRGSIRRIIPS